MVCVCNQNTQDEGCDYDWNTNSYPGFNDADA